MSRRLWPLAVMLALLALPSAATAAGDRNATRAVRTYRALHRYYWIPDQNLYRGEPYSYAWPFSQALSATIALAGLPGQARHWAPSVHEHFVGLRKYFDPKSDPPGYEGRALPPVDRGGFKNYDDNEWIGLELLRRNTQVRSSFRLGRAKDLFHLAVFGWDRDETHPCPGGVLFSQNPRHTDRNTVTNAPGAQLGYRIFLLTGNRYYRRWADRMYQWVRHCMSDEASPFYFDHIDFQGNIDPTIWTYNQGTMIGSNVLLYRTTGRRGYLKRARTLAVGAMRYFDRARLEQEPPPFVAIMFENMLRLDAVKSDPAYRRYMQRWADRAWKKMRDPNTDAFVFDPARSDKVATQAAFTKIYANLAWPRAAFE